MIKYAITDPRFYGDLPDLAKFAKLKEADFILYRNKTSQNYIHEANFFMKFATKIEAKFIIHNDIDLALKLNAHGVHFSSNNLKNISKAPSNLIKFASVHDENEIKKAQFYGANYLVFSPIFDTPNKKAVGLNALKIALSLTKLPIIALGGILTQAQIQAVLNVGAIGFASIRYFVSDKS